MRIHSLAVLAGALLAASCSNEPPMVGRECSLELAGNTPPLLNRGTLFALTDEWVALEHDDGSCTWFRADEVRVIQFDPVGASN